MRFIQQKNREQYFLPTSIDDYISNDNSIRFIDAFIEHIIESNSEDYLWKGLNDTGRTSYSPSTMHKLLIYGYLSGIQGSRKMENETYRNLELIRLIGDLYNFLYDNR